MAEQANNPFAALFDGSPVRHSSPQPVEPESTPPVLTNTPTELELIFGFTLDKTKIGFVYLEDSAATFQRRLIDTEVLEHAIFERVLLPNPNENVNGVQVDEEVCESRVICYLFNCLRKLKGSKVDETQKVCDLIMRNVLTALQQPDMYEGQDVFRQLFEVLKESKPNGMDFFIDIFEQLRQDLDAVDAMKDTFTSILKVLHEDVSKASPLAFPVDVYYILSAYSSHEDLALLLMSYCQPKRPNFGRDYLNTLLGTLLGVSILPKTSQDHYDFFKYFDPATVESQESILWNTCDLNSQNLHTLLLNLLKCSSSVKLQVLTWFGNCIKANADRGKLWNAQSEDMDMGNLLTVPDGFMINLVDILVRLCQPFCSEIMDERVLKVDPTYCAVEEGEYEDKNVHLTGLSGATCLVPVGQEPDDKRLTSSSYSFVTECFFMAHRAFDIGYRVAVEKLGRLNQDVVQRERTYNEVMGHITASEVVDSLTQRREAGWNKYLTLKCRLSEPVLLEGITNLICASSLWMSQVGIHTDFFKSNSSYAPLALEPITFPLPDKVPDTLKCVPEFVAENIHCYLLFLKRFNRQVFERQGYARLRPLLTFVLMYMGSVRHARNPHLRACLAEALEALLPYHKDDTEDLHKLGGHQLRLLFVQHEHRKYIVPNLLEVFVGIEMTGQSVQFEQKFNYRRPMYMIMLFLWEMDEYKQCFKELAEDAESNMEKVPPPVFLRFVNLLVNDAIFLLDESLENMAKLKELEARTSSPDFKQLPETERTRILAHLRQVGMQTKFDNILGRDTIQTLEYLTTHITTVFTHSVMVDRVAAMLNYFLLELVGPNKKNLKVKDQKEYHFDPAATVLDICKIYVNLKESEAFCLAVSQDGRSYSPQLFSLAEEVLIRIKGGQLIGELQDVARRVLGKEAEHQANEEASAEAPDHFLDPIMSTLMQEPVILPSSKQTVDRSTIVRHLLSDQTDPFNREPLTMDQVVPNTELAQEIQRWLEERRK